MRQMTSHISTAETSLTTSMARDVSGAARRNLSMVRSKSSPEIGVVSNFDPDQRGFTTDALQGFVMLQKTVGASTVGVLAVNGDYNRVAPSPGQTQSQGPASGPGITQTQQKINNNVMRVVPGQPQIIYPVASGSTSASLAYIKGGKVDYRRVYPAKGLTRNARQFFFGGDGPRVSKNTFGEPSQVVTINADAFGGLNAFLSGFDTGTMGWNENSPLPPGLRYVELEDIIYQKYLPNALGPGENIDIRLQSLGGITLDQYRMQLLQFPGDTYFTDYDSYLPHDSRGNIRRNRKPYPYNSFWYLVDYSGQDDYWGGDCDDPLNWQDAYWDGLDRDPTGNTPRVDRAAMKVWLEAHPKARYT